MPVTRIQTGHLLRRNYDAVSLQMDSISILSPENSPTIIAPSRSTVRGSGPRSPPKVTKNAGFKKPARKSSLTTPAAATKKRNNPAKNTNARGPTNTPNTAPKPRTKRPATKGVAATKATEKEAECLKPMEDICEGSTFFPRIAFGERETIGLSKIGRAEKEIEIWEEVLRAHEEGMPSLVPICQAFLEQAREKRASLEETEENLRVGDPNPAESAIKQRLEALEWALSTSKFEPEKENILGAMAGYQNGEIEYSDHYTLIYAGKVVDTAADYGYMVRDRTERLDRYAEAHGPHWLWWEPPLKLHPESQPRMNASVGLNRLENPTKLGQWYIKQGFWKRQGYVTRMPSTTDSTLTDRDYLYARDELGRVDCGAEGPKLAFRSLLDSGATYPSLHTADFNRLGIDGNFYGAQSVQVFNTANGSTICRVFELFVCVLDDDGLQLVDPNDAVWPDFAKYLGGLCPVVECSNQLLYDHEGMEIASRLSGLLPFVACYVSSVPTKNRFYLGEDRNDVLGGHRVPGQKKWDIAIPHDISSNPYGVADVEYGNPRIAFSHREGRILNEDDPMHPHASLTTFMKGTPQEKISRVNPRQHTLDLRAFEALQQIINSRAEAAEMQGLFNW